ncbi:MAG: hypothetical protein AB8G18_14670 [Gammaproteobacteria bacterium]
MPPVKQLIILICLGIAPIGIAQMPELVGPADQVNATHLTISDNDRLIIVQTDGCPAIDIVRPCSVVRVPVDWDEPVPISIYRDDGPGNSAHIWSENVSMNASYLWFLGETRVYRSFKSPSTISLVSLASKIDPLSTGEIAHDDTHIYWTENTASTGRLYRIPRFSFNTPELAYTNLAGPLRQLKASPTGGVLLVTSLEGGAFFSDTLLHIQESDGAITVTQGRPLTESYTFDDTYVYLISAFQNSDRTLVRAPLSNIGASENGVQLSNINDGTTIEYILADDTDLYYYRARSGTAFNFIYKLDKNLWSTGTPLPITGDIGVVQDVVQTNLVDPALWWRNSAGALFRLRKNLAQPVSTDLSIGAIEVVQAVQTPDNRVQLVAGKSTTIRVYPDILEASNVDLLSASVTLEVEDLLTGTTITPALPSKIITLNTSEPLDRENLAHSVNFEVPPQWIQGQANLSVRASITPLTVLDTNLLNNEFVEEGFLETGLMFEPKSPVCVKLLPIASTSGITYRTRSAASGTSTPGFNQIVELFNELYAAERMLYYTQFSPLRKPQFLGTPQPFNLSDNQDGDHLIAALWEHDLFDTSPEWCGGNNARTHYAAMVDPAVPTGVTGGYGSFALGYSWNKMFSPGAGETMAHEFGHNYNTINGDNDNWQHINCGLPDGSGSDDVYPYRDDSIGVDEASGDILANAGWGYNRIRRTVFRPDERADYMSYCGAWVSDYRWDLVVNAVGNKSDISTAPSSRELVSDVVAVFGLVDEDESSAEILSANLALPSAGLSVPADAYSKQSREGNTTQSYTLELMNGDGTVVQTQEVFPVRGQDGPAGAGFFFAAIVPWSGDTESITLQQNQTTGLSAINVSANAPAVSIVSPVSGSTIGDTLTVNWTGSDVDGDPLQYTVQYSADDGTTWSNIANGLTQTSITIDDARDIAGSATGAIRVLANDGVRIGTGSVTGLTVENRAPVAAISGPGNGTVYEVDETVNLNVTAQDAETGVVSDNLLFWDLQGPSVLNGVGGTATFTALEPGDYSLNATVQDPQTQATNQAVSRSFAVAPKLVPNITAPKLDGLCTDEAYSFDQHPIPLIYDDGSTAKIYTGYVNNKLYLCYSGIRESGEAENFGVYALFDLNGDGGSGEAEDNLFVAMVASETLIVQIGFEDVDIIQGVTGLSQQQGDVVSFEFEIDDFWLNVQEQGWNRTIGMQAGHADDIEDEFETLILATWPINSDGEMPDTYGSVALGALPQSLNFPPLPDITSGTDPLTLQATATSGLPVEYFSNTPQTCSIVDGNQLLPLAQGTCMVTASQFGSAAYFSAQDVSQTTFIVPQGCDSATDCDSDGVLNALDNCFLVDNPAQIDADNDNIGNACDADYNNDCIVNFFDVFYFTNNSFLTDDPLADHNNDGVANFIDYTYLVSQFLRTPGPSAISNQCGEGL